MPPTASTTSASERTPGPVEIDVGGRLRAVSFLGNCEYLVSGDDQRVRVWRVEDSKQVAAMESKNLNCLAVSGDGRWIAAGTNWGDIIVWDGTTYKPFWSHKQDSYGIYGVDFAPGSAQVVSSSANRTATIWDVATGSRRPVQVLRHMSLVRAAKYSPRGDRIATATENSVRVYDSSDGRLLVDISTEVTPKFNTGLIWFDDHLFVVSDGRIKQLDTTTGSSLSEWTVPDTGLYSCIAVPKHGGFIAYGTNSTVSFWSMQTHALLGQIEHQGIRSIVFSPDDLFFAIGGDERRITIESLSRINDAIPLPRLQPTFQRPDIQIDDAILNLWMCDQLEDAEVSLTSAITSSKTPAHEILASRALMRTRLRKWDTALADAEEAIGIQPSVMAYIAKSIAHVGIGERDKGYRACDIAFEHLHASHVTFLLLIKAIVVFMAGEHVDAISRIDDLISTVSFNSICYAVQAYMHFLLGTSHMESSNYERAIQSFERARTQLRPYPNQSLSVVSLIFGWRFDNLDITIRQRLCEALYSAGRAKDAVECFHQLANELGDEMNIYPEYQTWTLKFGQRSCKKLESLGDAAADALQYEEAISHYTSALSLNLGSPQGILIKRSRVCMTIGSWRQALDDANSVITLDPSSPWGYEMKHAALHKAGKYDSAVDALDAMHSKIEQSPDPDIQRRRSQYISPSRTRVKIRETVQRTIRRLPRVLINTNSGRLYERAELCSSFESLPIFNELVSSMTSCIDRARIKREVRQYFRYVMLSHKWEENEPLYQQIICTAVYDLDKSPTHDKLRMFCNIVRNAGFVWAWSDTCCINKLDDYVLREALVAMFKWYQGSAMVIVYLRGVRSSSRRGALMKSVWNTRAWTLQEYVAGKIIHFYTEDWTLYLNLQLPNHKESQEVISEMEEATGIPAQQLMALRPGLSSTREKLRLASTRQTTLVEDAAYSLLGIFSVTGVPVIYGEGEGSLGRLLAHILAGSGDASILAWTGESGSFNSCLPAHITVFSGPATSHLPAPIPDVEMESTLAAPCSLFDLDTAFRLYERLSDLPTPWFAASRMKLPCIAFQLPEFSRYRRRVYRTDTVAFGRLEIKTKHDLSQMQSLYLVHPWLDVLLERGDKWSVMVAKGVVPPPSFETDDEGNSDDDTDDDQACCGEEVDDDSSSLDGPEPSHPHPQATPLRPAAVDREMRVRRFLAYLRRPFGALLLTQTSTSGRTVDCVRVAADCVVTVQFRENVSLADILDNVRTLDVL